MLSIATVMLFSSPAFSGLQDEAQTSVGNDWKSSLELPTSGMVYREKQFDFGETGMLLAQVESDAVEVGEGTTEPEEMTLDEIAEMMANPFSYLWFGMIQNDTYSWSGDALDAIGEDNKIQNITTIQPVMSLAFTEKWRVIFRPVIPIASVDTITGFNFIPGQEPDEPDGITGNFERETGLGDIVLWTAFSPSIRRRWSMGSVLPS